jgi:hypothetical protein
MPRTNKPEWKYLTSFFQTNLVFASITRNSLWVWWDIWLKNLPGSYTLAMDKLQLTLQNLGRVFNSGSGHVYTINSCCYWAKQPNLKLKTQPKQLIGPLPLDFALPILAYLLPHRQQQIKSFSFWYQIRLRARMYTVRCSSWRHDIHHNDTQRNDIQHNDTQHKGLICDTEHKWHSA